MLAPNASSPCQRVSNGYLFQPLPVPNVAFRPDKKIKKNAAARGQSQRSKTQKMLAPNASSPCQRACRTVTCFNPCQCLTLLSDPIKKSRKMQLPAAKASGPRPKKCWLLTLHPPAGQSQRSKTQKMLAPNASSPCQRVSNGYLCQPLPVPNVAF